MKKYEEPKMKLHELKMKIAMLQDSMNFDTRTSKEATKPDLEDFNSTTNTISW